MSFICGFDIVNGGKTNKENPFLLSAVGVWLMCACVFVTKTMAVRIFQSAK